MKSAKLSPSDIGLKSDSFSMATAEIPHRLIANVEAREKEGKTTFCLTAPDPIIAYNFDLGLEGIAQHALREGKKLVVAGLDQGKHRMPAYFFLKPKGNEMDRAVITETAHRAQAVWKKFKEDFQEGLESKARTLVVDTGGAAFLMNKYARFGRLKRIMPRDFDELYQEFQHLMQSPMDYDKNVLWIHRLSPEWVDRIKPDGEKESVKTDRWVRKPAYRDVAFEVQANIRLEKYVDKKKQAHFKASIIDCRLNQGLDGVELEDDLCNFPEVASLVFGDDVGDWT